MRSYITLSFKAAAFAGCAAMACLGCARPARTPSNASQASLAVQHDVSLRLALDRAMEQQEANDGLHLQCHDRKFQDVINCPSGGYCCQVLGIVRICE